MLTDFKFALRTLAKSPGFTAVAILTLALGIGANTAVFSVVNGLLLQPLPYPEQNQLIFMGEYSEQVPNMSVSYPNYLDWRSRQQSFSSLGAFRGQSFNYMGAVDTERVPGNMLSHDLLTTLGVPPLLGRFFRADEDKPGAARTVLISERFWKRVFSGRPDALGGKLTLSGEIYTVIGVMPSRFEFPVAGVDLYIPVGLFADGYQQRGNHPGIYTIGRLKPRVNFDQAHTDMVTIARQLEKEYPQSNTGNSVNMQMLADRAFGQIRPELFTLLAAAGFVLLIACANVANLLLARAAARSRELVMRAALGAGRRRLIVQLLAESALLGLLGAIAGVAVAYWTIGAIKGALPAQLPNASQIALSLPVLGFALAAGVGTSLIFGLVPALASSRPDLSAALSSSARTGGGTTVGRWRAALIAGEFALTAALLLCAGLMIRTLTNIYRADPGFKTDRLLAFNWVMPGRNYSDDKLKVRLIDAALQKIAALPGVTGVGIISPLPMSGGGNQNSFFVEGMEDPGPGKLPSAEFGPVNPDYFATIGIPLIAGRPFTARDQADSPKVVIIDTTLAERYFPGQNPIGRRLKFGGGHGMNEPWCEIVGVVGHIQNYGIGQTTRFQTYVPYTQEPPASTSYVVRTTADPAALTSLVRAAMREVDPNLPIFSVNTMREVFASTVSTQKLALTLLGVFAGLALLLASIGLYGVLSYAVNQRTREIGVRMAIGASQGSVLKLIVGQGLRLALFGLGIGLLLAAGAASLIRSQLYEVSSLDPVSFTVVAAVLLVMGLFACLIPAWRATRVDPIAALRTE